MALKIEKLNPEMVQHYMITSQKSSPFADDLYMTLLMSMDELRQQASNFMSLEDVREY